ncbi:hypothetical protein CCP1ISM_20026 [Azospirillaceae bacterium]
MNQVIEHIVNVIKSSNLTFEERLAVVQDTKLISKYYSSDKMDLLTGLNKIQETISKESVDNAPAFKVKFNSYVNQSVKVLREDLAPRLMKPICELASNVTDMMQKGEGESDMDFKERMKGQEEVQDKNKDEFEKAQDKMKKGESKPLAKALRSKGMSQQELADHLDVHKSTISRLKTGKRKPSFELMSELGDTFGSVENLFPELK